MIGTGIVSLPYTFRLCGTFLGVCTLSAVVFIAYLGYVAVFRVVRKEHRYSYEELARNLPTAGRISLDVVMAITLVQGVTCYIIIGGHIILSVFAAFGMDGIDDRITFVCVALLMAPGSVMRSFEAFQWVSSKCFIGTIVLIAIIIYSSVITAPSVARQRNVDSRDSEWEADEFSGFALSMPIISAAMMAHVSAPLIYGELNDAGRSRISLLCAAVGIIALLVYGSVGLSGYMCFGADTSDDIVRDFFLFNMYKLRRYDPLITVAQAVLGSVIVLKAPLLMMPLRSMCINLLGFGSPNREESAIAYVYDNNRKVNYLLSASLLGFCLCVAVVVPQLSTMLEMSGAVSCTYLSYIIPGVFLRKSYSKSIRDVVTGWFLIISGCTMCIISVYAKFLF